MVIRSGSGSPSCWSDAYTCAPPICPPHLQSDLETSRKIHKNLTEAIKRNFNQEGLPIKVGGAAGAGQRQGCVLRLVCCGNGGSSHRRLL